MNSANSSESTPLLVIGNKNTSSWSMRPWLAMKMAGVDFEEKVVFFDSPEFASVVKKTSPTGKVPCLVHGDVVLWESLAICEYVAETWAPQLWPKDRKARALARAVANEMHAGFAALRKVCPMNLREDRRGSTLSPEAEQDARRAVEVWRTCRERFGASSGEGPFLFGAFSVADAMYAPVTTRFTTYGIAADDVGSAYIEAVQSLPAFQEWRREALAEP